MYASFSCNKAQNMELLLQSGARIVAWIIFWTMDDLNEQQWLQDPLLFEPFTEVSLSLPKIPTITIENADDLEAVAIGCAVIILILALICKLGEHFFWWW